MSEGAEMRRIELERALERASRLRDRLAPVRVTVKQQIAEEEPTARPVRKSDRQRGVPPFGVGRMTMEPGMLGFEQQTDRDRERSRCSCAVVDACRAGPTSAVAASADPSR